MDQKTLLSSAWTIVDRLEQCGEQAYLVGGYVRDKLLGRPVKDIDIATSAHPETVLRIFERAEPTGLQHGTVTVVISGHPYEVTTFRSESGYTDHRRPDEVRFIRSLREDLSRRDFTMNAMALGRNHEWIDPFGGKADLEAGVLRAVGDPKRRFSEDALRMLRCIRFAAEYQLEVERATWEALVEHASLISTIAVERIRGELERIVEGSDPYRGLLLLTNSGMVKHLPVSLGFDLSESTMTGREESLKQWGRIQDAEARWAYLYAVMGTKEHQLPAVLRKLTFANRKARRIHQLLQWHEHVSNSGLQIVWREPEEWKQLAVTYGMDTALQWTAMSYQSDQLTEEQAVKLKQWFSEMPVHELADLAVDGNRLLQAGIPPGPRIGRLLHHLLIQAAVGNVENNEKALLREAIVWLDEGER